MSSSAHDFSFKLILLGDTGVGKSSLVKRFVDDYYDEKATSTIGVDFKIRTISMQDKSIRLEIHDYSGQERFRMLSSGFSSAADGVVLVFDVADWTSFNAIEGHLQEMRRFSKYEKAEIILVGTKSDLKRRCIDYNMAKCYAQESLGCKYIETSAKTGNSVERLFCEFAMQIAQKRSPNAFVADNSGKPAAASEKNGPIQAKFTREEFVVELNRTVSAMNTDIATNAFFKPTLRVYDALRVFRDDIWRHSTPEEIIKAMGSLIDEHPQICDESEAKKLLQMTGYIPTRSCVLQ